MKTILLLIIGFGLMISLALNAYLISDIEMVWIELFDIHELLIEILEYLQAKSGISV